MSMSDPRLFQKIQDYFCKANGVYLSCIDKSKGVITKAYGENDGKNYYSLFKPYFKIISALK